MSYMSYHVCYAVWASNRRTVIHPYKGYTPMGFAQGVEYIAKYRRSLTQLCTSGLSLYPDYKFVRSNQSMHDRQDCTSSGITVV